MKRFLILLFLPLLLWHFPVAMAEEEDPEAAARKSLVEKYGYTEEEAQAFVFEKSRENDYAYTYHNPAHPEWTYERKPDMKNGGFAEFSPFSTPYRADASERNVRKVLREAGEKGWFRDWNKANRQALLDAMTEKDITRIAPALAEGTVSAAQAVHLVFTSAYGDAIAWPPAIRQWRDAVLAENGLNPSDVREAPAAGGADGIFLEKVPAAWPTQSSIVCFSGVPPLALRDALKDSRLTDWTLASGVLETAAGAWNSLALLLYEKGEDRLLLLAAQENSDGPWTLMRVDERCLLPGRTPKIRYVQRFTEGFALCYDDPGQPAYAFLLNVTDLKEHSYLCSLNSCVLYDEASGTGWYWEDDELTEYRADGTQVKTDGVSYLPFCLDQMDADDFPLTPNGIRAWTDTPIPEGFSVANEVHLRARTSSRSNDLGTFNRGALVQIEATLPGDPDPWYRVKCGRIEGYASSNYIDEPPSSGLQGCMPLPVARADRNIFLRQNTGFLSPSVTEVPEGTEMHVLLETGDWLYVCVPRNEIDWTMDVNGVYGYVRADEVTQAPTLAQLRWDALQEE